jgi:hypothetical protein
MMLNPTAVGRKQDATILLGIIPMRLAAALVMLIFAIMATSVAGTGTARSEMLSPIAAQPTAY